MSKVKIEEPKIFILANGLISSIAIGVLGVYFEYELASKSDFISSILMIFGLYVFYRTIKYFIQITFNIQSFNLYHMLIIYIFGGLYIVLTFSDVVSKYIDVVTDQYFSAIYFDSTSSDYGYSIDLLSYQINELSKKIDSNSQLIKYNVKEMEIISAMKMLDNKLNHLSNKIDKNIQLLESNQHYIKP